MAKTRNLTISALLSALAVVSLYLGSLLPTGQLGLAALASLFVAAAIIEAGLKSGVSVFIISSAIAMLIIPNRVVPLFYLLFFGYYPIIKSLIEKHKNVFVQWILKILVFNSSLTVIYFLQKTLIFDIFESQPTVIILYLLGNAVFALFDYGYSNVIRLYMELVSKKRKKDD